MNESQLRQKFVNEATKYVGVKEGSAKHKYVVDTYNKIVPLPSGYRVQYTDAWCATFVSFVAKECGLLDIIPAECSCNRQIELWKKIGRWEESDAYVPSIGDILYYSWTDNGSGDCTLISDHVGIVASVNGSKIQVVEGNYSDSVKCRIVTVNGKFIRGYGKPNFASRSDSTSGLKTLGSSSKTSKFSMSLQELKSGDSGEQVKALQILLIGRGYSLPKYGADGDYGDETVKAVKAFQKATKITQDGIAGKDTFSRLLLG